MDPKTRRILKRTVLMTGVAILVIALFFGHKFLFGRPPDLNHAVERMTIQTLLGDPELLSFVGLLDNTLLDFHSHKLTDASPARAEKIRRGYRRDLAIISGYDRDKLSPQKRLTYDVFRSYLQGMVDLGQFPYHVQDIMYPGPYPVNQLYGPQAQVPSYLVSAHRVVDGKSAENYVRRLEAFPIKFAQLIESLKVREDVNAIPPRFAVTKTIEQMEAFVSDTPSDNILFVSFQEKLNDCEEIDGSRRDDFETQALAAIEKQVYPAYETLLDYLRDLESRALTNDGVWRLQNGDDYYRALLRFHTTTDMTPDQIHELGLREVTRIEKQMREILAEQGYRGTTVAEMMNRLGKEKRFLYPDTNEGREQILEDYRTILAEIDVALDKYFLLLPEQTLEVRRVPVFKQEAVTGAYYNSPALDGSRPGVFYANLRSVEEVPRFGMRTLAYHEGTPGHHIQMALAQELKELPTFRKTYLFTAFTEGWALYAERLAWEMGFQSDPFSNIGRLQEELFRAVRLVVDTGLHHKRWTREEAIGYMLEKTGKPETEVVTEIERYLVKPGQACAYKVGMIKILQMREWARLQLGDDFDIRDFHRVVLENGSVPLDVLEAIVDDYIDTEKRGKPAGYVRPRASILAN